MKPTNTLALIVARQIRERHLYVYSFDHARRSVRLLRQERAAGRAL